MIGLCGKGCILTYEKYLGIGYYGDWIHVDTRGYSSRW